MPERQDARSPLSDVIEHTPLGVWRAAQTRVRRGIEHCLVYRSPARRNAIKVELTVIRRSGTKSLGTTDRLLSLQYNDLCHQTFLAS